MSPFVKWTMFAQSFYKDGVICTPMCGGPRGSRLPWTGRPSFGWLTRSYSLEAFLRCWQWPQNNRLKVCPEPSSWPSQSSIGATVRSSSDKLSWRNVFLDLFVDLDVGFFLDVADPVRHSPTFFVRDTAKYPIASDSGLSRAYRLPESALHLLLDDNLASPKILLEGGPGQGKSTITQMVAQVYREKFLGTGESTLRDPIWHRLCQLRIPIRLELRDLAHWITQHPDGTLEQYIARNLGRDSGGATVTVEDVQELFHRSAVILLLDGLDEIGNDVLRDRVLDAATEGITRFEKGLRTDVRVVLTTRPPAVLGRLNKLEGFTRVGLTPMGPERIDEYVDRWLNAQISTDRERHRIKTSFNSRRGDSHVEALARNPMQLSVLLQFIYLQGDAFPDRRADLYRGYFRIVIDRDVEKSPELRQHRELIEGLHSYLGFRLHGNGEVEPGRRALSRSEIIELAGHWLERQGHAKDLATNYFALGEERFGLIVALSGRGTRRHMVSRSSLYRSTSRPPTSVITWRTVLRMKYSSR